MGGVSGLRGYCVMHGALLLLYACVAVAAIGFVLLISRAFGIV
jgi:hypothetical protein